MDVNCKGCGGKISDGECAVLISMGMKKPIIIHDKISCLTSLGECLHVRVGAPLEKFLEEHLIKL